MRGPMTPIRCTLSVLLTVALTSACDGSPAPKDAAPAKVEAKDAKGGDAKPDVKAPTNPHAAGNPHAGMPPMMGAAAAPKGPPRDVTPTGVTVAETLPGLAFAVPKEWEKGKPSSNMRLAQWVLPGPGGDGELVVFRFPGGAGGIEANVARWKGQFQAPEGKTIDDVAITKIIEAGGLKTTLLDVSGTYVAAVVPGADEKHDDADQRMIAAIIEGSGDPFYFKAVGPRATMDVWAAAFETMANGLAGAGVVTGVAGGDAKADDAKAGDTKAGDTKAGDPKAADTKAADTKAADTKKAGG
jgi:hypothetical protein